MSKHVLLDPAGMLCALVGLEQVKRIKKLKGREYNSAFKKLSLGKTTSAVLRMFSLEMLFKYRMAVYNQNHS